MGVIEVYDIILRISNEHFVFVGIVNLQCIVLFICGSAYEAHYKIHANEWGKGMEWSHHR